MKYLTDIYALNLPCSLGTTGDWHAPCLDWSKCVVAESEQTLWADWRIEPLGDNELPPVAQERLVGVSFKADHVRSLADMVATGMYTRAAGMSEEYLDGGQYDADIFEHIYMLKDKATCWSEIDAFMTKEYRLKWLNFKNGKLNINE